MKTIYLMTLLVFTISCSNIQNLSKREVTEKPSLKPVANKEVPSQVSTDQAKTEPSVTPKIELKEELPKTIQTLTFPNSEKVKNYCTKIDKYFKKYRWGKSDCETYSWHHVRSSHLGNPIIWFTIGDERLAERNDANTTLILCGVHGDEITPIKFCFDVLKDLKEHPEVVKDKFVVIAPIVTPDSFFKKYPSRTNARGIDVNRNFPTKDWNAKAMKIWKHRYRSDKRRYPGKKSLSEHETIFQVNLIKRYKPKKIISVHAPLTLIDYDGPGGDHKHGHFGKELLIQMSKKAGKYRINNYPFFPGSLGNWAGNERNIPTYTLELPNSDWTKTKKFYSTFRNAIHHAIDHELKANHLSTKKVTDNNDTKQLGKKVVNETIL